MNDAQCHSFLKLSMIRYFFTLQWCSVRKYYTYQQNFTVICLSYMLHRDLLRTLLAVVYPWMESTQILILFEILCSVQIFFFSLLTLSAYIFPCLYPTRNLLSDCIWQYTISFLAINICVGVTLIINCVCSWFCW